MIMINDILVNMLIYTSFKKNIINYVNTTNIEKLWWEDEKWIPITITILMELGRRELCRKSADVWHELSHPSTQTLPHTHTNTQKINHNEKWQWNGSN